MACAHGLIPYTARDTTLKQSPGEGRGRGAPRGDQLRRLPRALPPHWNTLANYVTDHPLLERRLGGEGPVLDPLEWDVKLYLALNGAVHDAAVCAWGLKGHYDYVRPITAIRHMAGLGQSSDPELPSYDPHGLPLEPGVAELITEESAAPGERHAHLAEHIGEIAVYSWLRKPEEGTDYTGVDWILGIDWVPYQRDTFVTPPFAGYISGHSTFSRSAAEVMARFTGSDSPAAWASSWPRPTSSWCSKRPHRDRDAAVGDLLRRLRRGRHLAPLRRHRPAHGRPAGTPHRLPDRSRRLRPRPHLLRPQRRSRPCLHFE